VASLLELTEMIRQRWFRSVRIHRASAGAWDSIPRRPRGPAHHGSLQPHQARGHAEPRGKDFGATQGPCLSGQGSAW